MEGFIPSLMTHLYFLVPLTVTGQGGGNTQGLRMRTGADIYLKVHIQELRQIS